MQGLVSHAAARSLDLVSRCPGCYRRGSSSEREGDQPWAWVLSGSHHASLNPNPAPDAKDTIAQTVSGSLSDLKVQVTFPQIVLTVGLSGAVFCLLYTGPDLTSE